MSPTRAAAPAAGEFRAFVARLHFYIGLLVGPFLLVAAVTGVLYVLTPQLENVLYREVLRTASAGPAQPLAAQAEAARVVAGPGAQLAAVRPAPAPGWTTRVLFADPRLGESENRAIFVDPVTLAITGDMTVYGTSGILPFRTAIDQLHRTLLLGDLGRFYSELAASWLWILALGGICLWLWRRTGQLSRQNPANTRLRTRRLHGLLGVSVSLGLLFLSATGLTWSRWAGGRIDGLRDVLGWNTPAVTMTLEAPGLATAATGPEAGGDHAEHRGGDVPAAEGGAAKGTMGDMSGMDMANMEMPGMAMHGDGVAQGAGTPMHRDGTAKEADAPGAEAADPVRQLDAVLAASRAAGIDSPMVEVRLPRPGRAWMVREYDRSWPTQVDTIALDPASLRVTSRADFATFPLVAKLIRWGVDMHMGILFGVANQVLMAVVGLGLVGATLYGYRIWWRNRPAPGALPRTLVQAWLRLGLPVRAAVVLVAAALGWMLPVAGGSLLLFLLIDLLRWRFSQPAARVLPAE
ncbi:PepSY-associated TM helix domain-containing protein [Roseomonas elaeocarpi]|uniref:PepSY-associated TM helix domain-containing protein n=1 Tax=Roseomonas elaeocarpi TaxID=907779 RepID=A0ABV6JQ76_9PROT